MRLLREVEPVASDVLIGRVEQRQVVLVAVGGCCRRGPGAKLMAPSPYDAVRPARRMPLCGEGTEVDGVAAVRAADGDRDVLGARQAVAASPTGRGHRATSRNRARGSGAVADRAGRRRGRPGGRTSAARRRSARRTTRRRPRARTLGELPRVAVGARVDLVKETGVVGNDGRDHRALERTGGGDNVTGVVAAIRGLDVEAGPAGVLPHRGDLDAAPDRSRDTSPRRRRSSRRPAPSTRTHRGRDGELKAGEPVVPARTVGDQGVPPHGAPSLGDARALQDDMRDPVSTQVLAHRDPGLARADDEDLDLLVSHPSLHSDSHSATSVGSSQADSK